MDQQHERTRLHHRRAVDRPLGRFAVPVLLNDRAIAKGEEKMSELEATPELPDDTPIREVQFPERIKDALVAAGIKTVGEVRELSDRALLDLPDFGKTSLAHLRETLGLPSTTGVRPPKL
jgi:DNA-directed RNA polymerase alpha subunit